MADGQVIIDDAGEDIRTRTTGSMNIQNQDGSGNLLTMNELLSGNPHLISGAALAEVAVEGENPVTKENPSDVKVFGGDPTKPVTLEVQNVTGGGVEVTPSQALTESEPNVPIYTTINLAPIHKVSIDGQVYQESGGATVTLSYTG
jgi:hypothetical protein